MAQCECPNCGWKGDEEDTFTLPDDYVEQAMVPGDELPAGTCPECEEASAFLIRPSRAELIAALMELRAAAVWVYDACQAEAETHNSKDVEFDCFKDLREAEEKALAVIKRLES